ncbi:hypothetical protein VB264_15495 [Arcicella aquatica]|uniref:TANFOR domain-containing protein n=1 Tax=Arcicella aquatica TaxID=217141 RepID=A0ABU5QQ39_9BACT|nr:hypothetical protein [Arcicella aquatica]MEA5259200.1 hypothetical protein [Arcicella aquatica]
MKRILFYLLLVFLAFQKIQAQQLKVTVQLILAPPYSPRVVDFVDNPNKQSAIVIITNNGEPVNTPVKIVGQITNRSTGGKIFTSANYKPDVPILLNPVGQPMQINFGQANSGFIDANNTEVVGFDKATKDQIVLSGIFPQGYYDFCVYAVPYDATVQSFQNITGQCQTIPLAFVEPPRLTMPSCGYKMIKRENVPQQQVFTWSPPIGNISGGQIRYDFYLLKVPDGQNPNDAMDNAIKFNVGNPFTEKDIISTSLNYTQAEPELMVGKYVWRIVAKDQSGEAVFQNDGQSQICTFDVEAPPAIPALPPPPRQAQVALVGASSCKDTQLPDDKTAIYPNEELVGKKLKLGKFDLSIDEISKKGDGYDGNGRVFWNSIPIKVVFTNINFNAAYQIFSGDAQADNTQYNFPDPKELTKMSTWKQLAKGGQGFDIGSYVDAIEENSIQKVNALLAVKLPVGIPTKAGFIGINYMRFSAHGADMGALFNMKMPEANQFLSMAAVDVCMVPNKAFAGDANLILVDDFKIPAIPFNFIQGKYPNPDDSGTYARIAGDSIQHVHAVMDLNFGDSFLKLDDGTGKVIAGDVKARMVTDFLTWNDWVATVNMPAFTVDGLKDFTINGVNAFYDHSDKRNPVDFHVPDEYKGDRGATFRGLYMKKTEVKLPTKLKGTNDQRLGFVTSDFIIDDSNEVTAVIEPSNKPVVDYSTGKIGDWGFSIDDFKIKIVQNRFELGMMKGKLQFPISNDYLSYSCNLRSNLDTMQFVIEAKENYDVPIMMARMKLDKNSSFLLEFNGNTKKIDLDLSGSASIGLTQKSPIAIPLVKFEHFKVSNTKIKPTMQGEKELYLDEGEWTLLGGLWDNKKDDKNANKQGGGPAFDDENLPTFTPVEDENKANLVGFPIELTPPKFIFRGMDAIGFGFGVKVNVGGGDNTIVGAETKVEILGKLSYVNGKMTPAFSKVALEKIMIKGAVGPATVEGELRLFDEDAVFGTGFIGSAKVKIPKVATVKATLQFGNKGFYYGYVDASVLLTPSIAVLPPLMCSGFGGGIYFNMKMNTPLAKTITNVVPNAQTTRAGTSNTGINYVPMLGSYGIKANVYMSLADKKMILANLGIEASIANGAFSNFTASGKAKVLSLDEDPDKNGQCLLTAQTSVTITPSSFDMSADVEVEPIPGFVKVTVPFRMHFADTWHVKVGDPAEGKQKVAFKLLQVGSPEDALYVYLGAKAYFAFGNDLGGVPALPQEVQTFLLGKENVNDNRNDVVEAAKSKGDMQFNDDGEPVGNPTRFSVLAGARLDGHLKVAVGPLSANATLIAGFDAALSKGLKCNGQEIVGLYGWYANTQIYAYANGNVSVAGKVFGKRFNVKLMDLTAGALLWGGLPEPTWGEGRLRVAGSVLGGLVKVDTDFDFDFGHKCKAVFSGDPLADIKVISELSPKKGEKDVDTNGDLQAVFNMSMDTDYSIALPDGQPRTYYFTVQNYSLTNQKTNEKYNAIGAKQWVNNNEQLILPLNGHLKSETNYAFKVQVRLWERVNNGLEDPYIDETGVREQRFEEAENIFTSGKQPDFVRWEDVAYTWPMDGQNYFLKNQTSQIVISGDIPDELLTGINIPIYAKKDYDYQAYFIPESAGDTLKTAIQYQAPTAGAQGKILANIPANLQNSKVYRLELHKLKVKQYEAINFSNSINRDFVKIGTGNNATAYQIKFNSLKIQNKQGESTDKVMFSLAFKTSQFNTFQEKMASTTFQTSKYEDENNPQSNAYLFIKAVPSDGAENFEDDEMKEHKFSSRGALQSALLTASVPAFSQGNTEFDKYANTNIYSILTEIQYGYVGQVNPNYNNLRNIAYQPTQSIAMGRALAVFGALEPYNGNTIKDILGGNNAGVPKDENGLGASIGSASSKMMTMDASISKSVVSQLVLLSGIYGFTVNDAPARPYQFTLKSDFLAYHDFMAVRSFGEKVQRVRSIYQQYFGNNWKTQMERSSNSEISFASKTVGITASYEGLLNNPSIFDRFGNYVIADYYSFKKRKNGSIAKVNLTYQPYPGATKALVSKDIQVGASPILMAPVYNQAIPASVPNARASSYFVNVSCFNCDR